jgi:hypothetical protein
MSAELILERMLEREDMTVTTIGRLDVAWSVDAQWD